MSIETYDSLNEQLRKVNLKKLGEINIVDNLASNHVEKGILAMIVAVFATLAALKIESSAVPGIMLSLEVARQLILSHHYRTRAKEQMRVLKPFLDLSHDQLNVT